MAENEPSAPKSDTPNDDELAEEYAYLDSGGFSSEKFKIEMRGLPKEYGIAELKDLINVTLGLNTSKIEQPKHGSHWLYACFQNEEDRTAALAALNGYSWKGETLIAEVAKPAPDPFVKKRKQDEGGPTQDKRKKDDSAAATTKRRKRRRSRLLCYYWGTLWK